MELLRGGEEVASGKEGWRAMVAEEADGACSDVRESDCLRVRMKDV